MFKLFSPTTGQHSAIAQAQVRPIIEDGDVALAEKTRNSAECSAKAAIEENRVFAAEKFCDSRFQFAMQIGHAREHGRPACAQTVRIEGVVGRSNDLRM